MAIRRARRMEPVRGFGIDRVAAAADEPARANPRWPVLRLENLDTDLPLPPEAVRVTREALETPPANSWLPFTGDLELRAAIADFTAERTGHRYDPARETVLPVRAMERLLFDGRPLVHPLRFEGMAERTLVVGSLSKEHRMIGWRVGWVAGPADTIADVGWMHVYNTTTPVGIARAAATAVLRGDQAHVDGCIAELERRRDTLLAGLAGWPLVRPGGGWSLLLDVSALGLEPEEASRLLLQESSIAATGMRGWGGDVAARYVRFVFSAEPVERLETIPERLAGGLPARAL